MDYGEYELEDDFSMYMCEEEPEQTEKAAAWQTAIGLQAVDGLQVSSYLKKTAERHILGDISIDQVKGLLDDYYANKANREQAPQDQEEADKASANIAKMLGHRSFTFSPMGLMSIHKGIFSGIFPHAGKLRPYNISKREWVLQGDSVLYTDAGELRATLEYDFAQEKKFDYTHLEPASFVAHFSKFIAGIWQIHPFAEGNTRTTAVFAIKYLRYMGFDIGNDMFHQHSWYFRNALVRANYSNYRKKIKPAPVYLERFFRNLLFGENNALLNRSMLIDAPPEWQLDNPTSDPTCSADNPTSAASDPTSTRQVPGMLNAANANVSKLVQVLGTGELNVKGMLAALGLRDREHFYNAWLHPAMDGGWVRLKYPDSPRHPRQKYLLTEKGLLLFRSVGAGN